MILLDQHGNEKVHGLMKDKELDTIAQASLLYDFYGALLTDKQREVMELYHEENYSIVEIADELGVTKQAIHENLRKSEKRSLSGMICTGVCFRGAERMIHMRSG